ncbi:hypothetical protein BO85DRAFT_35466 [Aspergillus piperis CBS 112811]|uniref:Uncharacterized protein n=1 Tax=Aspergillus piperis CBS 112811 TaxID=1448313 RepID=A0A8G1VM61_9EURO|nr:hypothetical protein BO85DRAFT_35466 [Aspergillus piperis CBS 112811]RAH57202.1 hypothetical protein BO85DRAFT_35466 [Aspergillus piperis CBS 112811]
MPAVPNHLDGQLGSSNYPPCMTYPQLSNVFLWRRGDWEFVGKKAGEVAGLGPRQCCDVVIRRPDKKSSGEELPRPQQHPVLGLGTVSILMRDICHHRCQVMTINWLHGLVIPHGFDPP